jgi:hypothetical protein
MSVSCECCVLSVEVSATSWSLVQRSPTECGVSQSVIVKRRKMRRPRPPRAVDNRKKNPHLKVSFRLFCFPLYIPDQTENTQKYNKISSVL